MRVFLKKDKLYENKTCVINGLTTLSFPARWFRLPEGNLGTREAVVTDFYFHDVKYAMFTSIPWGWEIEIPRSESLWDMSSFANQMWLNMTPNIPVEKPLGFPGSVPRFSEL